MYRDSELEQLLGELKKIEQRPKLDNKPAYTMDENDINLLYGTSKKKTLSPTSNQSKKTNSIDKNFILNIAQKRHSATDKELTLGEYLEKYNQVDTTIEKERKQRVKYQNPGLEKLIDAIEDNERKPVNTSFTNKTKNNNLFLSRKVDERIDYEQDRREQKSNHNKTLFVGDKVNKQDVFSNNSKEERKPVFNRIENFSNTKANVTRESFMSPLALEKFSTRNR